MVENQVSLMEKIKIMEKWIVEHLRDGDKIRMNTKERGEHINSIFNVSESKKAAKAILQYMRRGHVFDMPIEIQETKNNE